MYTSPQLSMWLHVQNPDASGGRANWVCGFLWTGKHARSYRVVILESFSVIKRKVVEAYKLFKGVECILRFKARCLMWKDYM